MSILIADTAPLIFLAKLTLLDALCGHVLLVVPLEVAEEATRRQDLPDAEYIRRFIEEKKIAVARAAPKTVTRFQKTWGLGRGESAALLLAQARKLAILTDDYPAMRVAKALRLSFLTTPLLIVEMKERNLISLELARAKLDRLQEYAWLSPDVLTMAQERLAGR